MKNHNEMVDAVFQRKREYESRKSISVKRAVTVLWVFIALSVATISVYAITYIIKEKNIYQKAYDDGISISEVDTEGNFAHEDFSSYSTTDSDTNDGYGIEKETFEDPKAEIFNKMLNTIDYFNYIDLTLETSMLSAEKTIIQFQVNIENGSSYEAVTENGFLTSETYTQSGNMIYVDNKAKTHTENYLPVYTRNDTPYIKLADRITTEDDGLPCYHYRRNITNCPLASYSILPQELAFSYLKDFDKWEISNENIEFLDRNCVVISGEIAPYISGKHGADKFTMYIDSQTGILMKLVGFINDEVAFYTVVTSCSFEDSITVKEWDEKMYADYSKQTR